MVNLKAEVKKQLIDQPLHVLMAAASVWAIGYPVQFFAPVWIALVVAGVLTAAWVAYREYRQWPSSRWWDPPLDWFFEAVGLGLGCGTFMLQFGG